MHFGKAPIYVHSTPNETDHLLGAALLQFALT